MVVMEEQIKIKNRRDALEIRDGILLEVFYLPMTMNFHKK